MHDFEVLEGRLIRKALGSLAPKDLPRARKILRLVSYRERRCTLISKMLDRAESLPARSSKSPHSIMAKTHRDNSDIFKKWYARQAARPEPQPTQSLEVGGGCVRITKDKFRTLAEALFRQ